MNNIIKCLPKTTLFEAIELLNKPESTGILVVVNEDDQMLGTLELHHVRKALMENEDFSCRVDSFMEKNPIVASKDSDLYNIAETSNGYIPVLDKNRRIKYIYQNQKRWKTEKASKNEKLRKIITTPEASIKKVIRIFDTTDLNIALVVDSDNKLLGLVTERDIRDAILEGYDSETAVERIMNKNPVTALQGLTKRELIRLMDSKIELSKLKIPESNEKLQIKIPVLDEKRHLKGLVISDELNPESTFFFIGDDDSLFKNRVKNVLITGGAGYIGSLLCRKLLKKGFKVRILDNLLYGDEPIKDMYSNPDFELIKGDIRHIEDVVSAIQGIDAVIHLAAIVGDSACSFDPKFTIESNYFATKLLASACKYHQINRFLFSSTCSVYGASSKKLNETSGLNPVSLYARSKIYSENAILEMMDENFSPTILRLGTVYGLSPRPRFDLVLNIFVAKAFKGEKIEIEGGKQYRPLIHVSDVAEGFIACLEAPIENARGEIFNVGSNKQNYKIMDLGKEVIKIVPDSTLKHLKTKNDPRDYWVNFDKISNKLSYKTKISINEGIHELFKFLKQTPGIDYKDSKYYNHQILPIVKNIKT